MYTVTYKNVRLVFYVMPRLNILCTSSAKRYYTKIAIHRSRITHAATYTCNHISEFIEREHWPSGPYCLELRSRKYVVTN